MIEGCTGCSASINSEKSALPGRERGQQILIQEVILNEVDVLQI